MKTTLLCVLGTALLVAIPAVAGERPSSVPTNAFVVKLATFANQTGPIPQTTIFTPTADGFFRASIFGEVVVTNSANPSNPRQTGNEYDFCPVLSFNDDSGAVQSTNGEYFPEDCVPVIGTLTNSSASTIYFFRAKANSPITFSTTPMAYGSGQPPVAPYAYTVYIVLERF